MDQKKQNNISEEIEDKTNLGLAYKDAKKEWLAILSELWIAFDKPVDLKRIQIYVKRLSNVPTGLLDQAVQRTIENQEYHTVPTLHSVFDSLKKILYDPPDLDIAITAWCEASLNRCIQSNFEIDPDHSIPGE